MGSARPLERGRPRGGGDRRMPVVVAGRESRIGGGGGDVPGLLRGHRRVPLGLGRALGGGRLSLGPAGTARVTDIRAIAAAHILLVRMLDLDRPEIVDGLVVGEVPAGPPSAVVAAAAIAIAVIDAAVEADVRPPVTVMEQVGAADPAPPGRGPQHVHLRRLHPGARHPVVIGVGIGPVARGPDIPDLGHRRLHIDRQQRRRDLDRDPDRDLRARRGRRHQRQRARHNGGGEEQAPESHVFRNGHHTLTGTGKISDPPARRLTGSGTGIIGTSRRKVLVSAG